MNEKLMRSFMSMIPPETIASAFEGIPKLIAQEKNKHQLVEGETESVIVLFEDADGNVNASIAALNDEHKIVRQIETYLVKDLIMKFLTPQQDVNRS